MKEGIGSYRITDLHEDERPRERLMRLGAASLTTAELLAILLRVGTAGENAVQVGQHLLQQYQGLQGIHRASVAELTDIKGVGMAKAAQIKAALELGKRLLVEEPSARVIITKPEDAANLVRYEMSGLNQEHFRVILLDVRNRVLAIEELYHGTANGSPVRIAEVFQTALKYKAQGIILVHNHPSGNASASPEDIRLTRDAMQAGKLMDINVLDHIIIGGSQYISLREKRLMGD